jgi:hypothetical protein
LGLLLLGDKEKDKVEI